MVRGHRSINFELCWKPTKGKSKAEEQETSSYTPHNSDPEEEAKKALRKLHKTMRQIETKELCWKPTAMYITKMLLTM